MHTKLYRFPPGDYNEIAAVFNEVERSAPAPAVFAPDYAPDEIGGAERRPRPSSPCRPGPMQRGR